MYVQRAGERMTEPPTAYEMGVDFVPRDELPDTIPVMSATVDGWAVYSSAEGESPVLEDFFVDREKADAAVVERDADDELVLFDAFVFDAILLPEGLVTSNDFEIRSHDDLRKRIEEWRRRGGLGEVE